MRQPGRGTLPSSRPLCMSKQQSVSHQCYDIALEPKELQADTSQSGRGAALFHNGQPLQKTSMHQHLNVTHMTLGHVQLFTTSDGVLLALATIIKEGWPEWRSDVPEDRRTFGGTSRNEGRNAMESTCKSLGHRSKSSQSKRDIVLATYEGRCREIMPHASSVQSSRLSPEHGILALNFIPLSPMGKWESRKICESSKKHHEEKPANLWLALLEWRNIPTSGLRTSPVQLLMSRRTRTQMPTSTGLLKPRVPERVPNY
ncbi:hypothetical protein PR048_017530 [Dryococelus australis]|uniref:Uncharacterized protein n=1 Tax=Dryococelus australis TaxID=614101 RepID=A0ABQ9H9S5_9NEOP|nr:hypothetical protein PR048_017530 [Dryococelus australis]